MDENQNESEEPPTQKINGEKPIGSHSHVPEDIDYWFCRAYEFKSIYIFLIRKYMYVKFTHGTYMYRCTEQRLMMTQLRRHNLHNLDVK